MASVRKTRLVAKRVRVNLKTTLGDMIGVQGREQLLPKPEAAEREDVAEAVALLATTVADWKEKIRAAAERAVEKADNEASVVEAELMLAPPKTRKSKLELLESRVWTLREIATGLTDRNDWVFRDEIEDLLEPMQRRFIGQELGEDGEWDGGYWRWDSETSAQGAVAPTRTFVDLDLIERIATRRMSEIVEILDSTDPGEERTKQLRELIEKWR